MKIIENVILFVLWKIFLFKNQVLFEIILRLNYFGIAYLKKTILKTSSRKKVKRMKKSNFNQYCMLCGVFVVIFSHKSYGRYIFLSKSENHQESLQNYWPFWPFNDYRVTRIAGGTYIFMLVSKVGLSWYRDGGRYTWLIPGSRDSRERARRIRQTRTTTRPITATMTAATVTLEKLLRTAGRSVF